MERGRPPRVRGGSWRRGGGGGGNDGESPGGEHRGRGGRGGQHRGRGRRDHYRGRGRGGGGPAASFHRGQDEGVGVEELEDEGMEVFSRRKLESNWDRYKESEREQPSDDTPTQRGTDYHILLESAGDSFTQFRFSEEKEWEMEPSAASQMFVDLPALVLCLQDLPLHHRLNLEAELVQVSTPVELPTVTLVPTHDLSKVAFKPPATAFKGLDASLGVSSALTSVRGTSSSAAECPEDDVDDEELDQLLSLQRPISEASENQSVSVPDQSVSVPDKEIADSDESSKIVEEVPEVQVEDEKEKEGPPPKAVAVKAEVTEDDLEDWLDSMIS